MRQMFDYFENMDFAATVCDRDGLIIYQNACARNRDGSVLGRNLFDCHSKKSQSMIRHMMESGASNTYETIRHGKRRLIHQSPWRETPDGKVAGLVEQSIELPDEYPVLNRDKE